MSLAAWLALLTWRCQRHRSTREACDSPKPCHRRGKVRKWNEKKNEENWRTDLILNVKKRSIIQSINSEQTVLVRPVFSKPLDRLVRRQCRLQSNDEEYIKSSRIFPNDVKNFPSWSIISRSSFFPFQLVQQQVPIFPVEKNDELTFKEKQMVVFISDSLPAVER